MIWSGLTACIQQERQLDWNNTQASIPIACFYLKHIFPKQSWFEMMKIFPVLFVVATMANQIHSSQNNTVLFYLRLLGFTFKILLITFSIGSKNSFRI